MEGGKPVVKEIPMGFCLWSTGVSQFNNYHLLSSFINLTTKTAQNEFCRALSKKLDAQNNVHALETDTHLRLTGAPLGDVYAIGDCATVQNNVTDHLVTFLRKIAVEKGKDQE